MTKTRTVSLQSSPKIRTSRQKVNSSSKITSLKQLDLVHSSISPIRLPRGVGQNRKSQLSIPMMNLTIKWIQRDNKSSVSPSTLKNSKKEILITKFRYRSLPNLYRTRPNLYTINWFVFRTSMVLQRLWMDLAYLLSLLLQSSSQDMKLTQTWVTRRHMWTRKWAMHLTARFQCITLTRRRRTVSWTRWPVRYCMRIWLCSFTLRMSWRASESPSLARAWRWWDCKMGPIMQAGSSCSLSLTSGMHSLAPSYSVWHSSATSAGYSSSCSWCCMDSHSLDKLGLLSPSCQRLRVPTCSFCFSRSSRLVLARHLTMASRTGMSSMRSVSSQMSQWTKSLSS